MDKKQELQTALTAAMKSRDEVTKRTLRLVMSAIKLAEVEQRGDIDNTRVIGILQKEVKTRQDSIEEAVRANRSDLVEAANHELEVLNRFLPQQLTQDELTQMAKRVIEQLDAKGLQAMGEVMKILMPELAGRSSGQEASRIVRELLQNN
jgi:uncharacterized protein